MTLPSILLGALVLSTQGAGAAPGQEGMLVDGKPVELTFPAATAPVMSPEVAGWRGWKYLAGSSGRPNPRYVSAYDWSSVRAAEPAKGPLEWRERIVLVYRTENLVRDRDGVLQLDRHSIESLAMKDATEAIARVAAWISAETKGRLKWTPQVSIEREPMRAPAYGPAFATRYFGPRINGGGYEAEDKVYRGPYHGGIYVLPGAYAGPTETTVIYGAPVVGVPKSEFGRPFTPGDLEVRLHQAWLDQVKFRLAQRGIAVRPDAPAGAGANVDVWAEAVDLSELPTATRLERLQTPVAVSFSPDAPAPRPVTAPLTTFTDATLDSDADKGQVLHITEKGVDRNGGLALPVRADNAPLAQLGQTPALSFEVRSAAKDPIGVTVVGTKGKAFHYSLGRGRHLDASVEPSVEVPFRNDGTWQKIVLDLRPMTAAGEDSVASIAIEATPEAQRAGRDQAEPIDLFFNDFQFTGDAPTAPLPAPAPAATSADPEERALFAAKATAPSTELVTLLTDKSQVVRLNACEAYTRIKDHAAEAGLTADVMDLDPGVGSQAVLGLFNQGSDAAMAAVLRSIRYGVTEYTRETAARRLGETKDPKYGNDIVLLLADRSWLARLASVEALGNLPGQNAQILRMAFIEQDNPEIKLAVTRSSDPADEYEMRKLLWSAVNETSDLVRAESDIKLIQSPRATEQAEGYKGVRDDSRTTRTLVLSYLIHAPAEAHRAALRVAVADRSAAIRCLALQGFAALEKGATADEVANVLTDRDPDVQLALIQLSAKRGLALPDATLQAMAACPDERVKAAVKALKP